MPVFVHLTQPQMINLTGQGFLSAVGARATNDVWFVGAAGPNLSDLRTFAAHYTGGWTTYTPLPGEPYLDVWQLNAVSVLATGHAWAIGEASNPPGEVWAWPGSPPWAYQFPAQDGFASVRGDAIAALSDSAVWMAGATTHPLVYWDGSTVTEVPPGLNLAIRGLGHAGAGAVWYAGQYGAPNATKAACGQIDPLVPVNYIGASNTYLYGVYVEGNTSVAAVGAALSGAVGIAPLAVQTLDGTTWTDITPAVAGDDAGTRAELTGVHGVAYNDLWAVGWYTKSGGAQWPYVYHWNGSAWTRYTLDTSLTAGNTCVLYGVWAIATDDVWAVGQYYDSTAAQYKRLAVHWDGSAWSGNLSP